MILLLGAVSIFGRGFFFVMFGAGTRFDEGMYHVWVCACYVWVCVYVCGCVYVCVGMCMLCVGMCMLCVAVCMCGCSENCVGVLVICVLVYTVFCIVLFMYIYSYLLLV